MNREDIIRMAQAAGLGNGINILGIEGFLERFFHMAQAAEREAFAKHAVDIARRAIKEEREACAKVCDGMAEAYEREKEGARQDGADACAAAIRARGNQ